MTVSTSEMELLVLPGDYALPSMDCECTRLILFTKFAQVPVKIKECTNPLRQTNGKLPQFTDEGKTFADFVATVDHLRAKRYSLDFGLNGKECSEMLAYVAMVGKLLKPILEFVFWVDKQNFEEFTRAWHMKAMPPVLNLWYIRGRRKKAQALVEIQCQSLESEAELAKHFKTVASEVFTVLSSRLGNLNFFYGSSPTSLDCIVYAYLAPLVKIPLPSNEISNLLFTFPKLLSFLKRVEEAYDLPSTSNPKLSIRKREDADASLKLKLLTTTFVVCAMAGYAVLNGIVSAPRRFRIGTN